MYVCISQTLFEFDDCLNGGAEKALAAAAKLRKIFPDCQSRGVSLSIPMPGHAIPTGADERVRADVAALAALVAEHDAVFLLTDSREARWLPTLLCAAAGKLCLTTALGFDTFVVMRHGALPDEAAAATAAADAAPYQHLGCYFCNDVVAPRDSLTDRTLDQQCTVTRPAVSMLASALAVELLVGVLHHPSGVRAPADEACDVSKVRFDDAASIT